jgi:hypothetical protein
MSNPKARLAHLLALADQGPSLRAALAEEVADLLMDWPSDYPAAMRVTFEALLEKASRDVDDETRNRLVARIGGDPADPLAARVMPLEDLNPIFFTAAPAIRNRILARNQAFGENEIDEAPQDIEAEARLLAVARCGEDCSKILARTLDLPTSTAREIFADPSAQALAIACKGAHLGRAAFSALALLSARKSSETAQDCYALLSSYDAVSASAAGRILESWRNLPPMARAAE